MLTEAEQQQVNEAFLIVQKNLYTANNAWTETNHAKEFFTLLIGGEEKEQFVVLFLDAAYRPITHEIMFNGTINFVAVHTREIIERVIEHKAAAVMLAHNHPNGISVVSEADIKITKRIQVALDSIEVDLIDHIIVGNECMSMLELGYFEEENTQASDHKA